MDNECGHQAAYEMEDGSWWCPNCECLICQDDIAQTQLDLLEQLLAITERFKPQMSDDELRLWSDVSARTADIRDRTDV